MDKTRQYRGGLELLSPWQVKAYCPFSGLALVTLESGMGPESGHAGHVMAALSSSSVPVILILGKENKYLHEL